MNHGPGWHGPPGGTQTWGEQALALRQARQRNPGPSPDHSLDPAIYLVLGVTVLVLVVVILLVRAG